MPKMADITGTLSICRRAGKLIGGMDEVKGSCFKHEARCVLIARDFSENSKKEIERVCEREKVPVYEISESMDDIGYSVGKRFGVMSVTDAGFAKSIVKKLATEK